jgi:hypothetical protein
LGGVGELGAGVVGELGAGVVDVLVGEQLGDPGVDQRDDAVLADVDGRTGPYRTSRCSHETAISEPIPLQCREAVAAMT